MSNDVNELIQPVMDADTEEYEEPIELYASQPAMIAVMRSTRSVAEKLSRKVEEMKKASAKLRQILSSRIRRLLPDPPRHALAAVDSTYPTPHLELIGGKINVVVAGYVLYNVHVNAIPRSKAVAKTIFSETEEEFSKMVSLESKLMERRLIAELLEAVRKRLLSLDMIIIDGEIVPYPLLFTSPRVLKRSRLAMKLVQVTDRMLELADALEIPLVGVIKRSYSFYASVILGERTPVNDKALMSLVLDAGEYAILGSYADILPKYANYVKTSQSMESEKIRARMLQTIHSILDEHPHYRNVELIFYRPYHKVAYGQAVKLEVFPRNSLSIEEVSSLAKMTSYNAVPWIIDVVDEYVRFEAQALGLLRRKLESELARSYGKFGVVLTGLTNPQKSYLYEPPTYRMHRHLRS
ncbi:MAG: hypothetical protein DRO12_02820 [Thermoprotei archaeon]|nr:MAG: hypothetical protein DRO12_02820 [Thermoprotei archaeon]